MKIALCNTLNLSSPHGPVIVRVTGAQFGNHSLLRILEDSGTEIYFESHWKRDPQTGKTGMRGPMLYDRVLQWRDANPTKHIVFEQAWLPLTDEEIYKVIAFLAAATHDIKYAHSQLLRNYLVHRLHFSVRFGRHASGMAWTCSEAVARALVHVRWEIARYLGLGEITLDDLVPSSPRRGGLYEALDQYISDCLGRSPHLVAEKLHGADRDEQRNQERYRTAYYAGNSHPLTAECIGMGCHLPQPSR